jgi:hypothetical protein
MADSCSDRGGHHNSGRVPAAQKEEIIHFSYFSFFLSFSLAVPLCLAEASTLPEAGKTLKISFRKYDNGDAGHTEDG